MGTKNGIHAVLKPLKLISPASLPPTTSLYVDASVIMHSVNSTSIELALAVAQITPTCATLGSLVSRYAAAIVTYSSYTRTTDKVIYVFEGIAEKAVTEKRRRTSASKKNTAYRNALFAPKCITRRKAAEKKLAFSMGRPNSWFVNLVIQEMKRNGVTVSFYYISNFQGRRCRGAK